MSEEDPLSGNREPYRGRKRLHIPAGILIHPSRRQRRFPVPFLPGGTLLSQDLQVGVPDDTHHTLPPDHLHDPPLIRTLTQGTTGIQEEVSPLRPSVGDDQGKGFRVSVDAADEADPVSPVRSNGDEGPERLLPQPLPVSPEQEISPQGEAGLVEVHPLQPPVLEDCPDARDQVPEIPVVPEECMAPFLLLPDEPRDGTDPYVAVMEVAEEVLELLQGTHLVRECPAVVVIPCFECIAQPLPCDPHGMVVPDPCGVGEGIPVGEEGVDPDRDGRKGGGIRLFGGG